MGRKAHFDICRSFCVSAPAGESAHEWVHTGWEIVFASRPAHAPAFKLRNKLHGIRVGQFLLFNSEEPHTEIYPHDYSAQFQDLVFTLPMLASVFEGTGIKPEDILFQNVSYDFRDDINESIATIFLLRDGQNTGRLAFECLSVELILKLLEYCPSTESAQLKKMSNRGFYPSNVAKAQKIMAENIGNAGFTLDELAEQAGLSKFHLIRSFKQTTGLSPVQYLNEIRFDLAKALLEKGKPVYEVSEQVGYNTFSAFSKAFKLRAGRAPANYRARALD
jgi:AraC-like DNA-binding protein